VLARRKVEIDAGRGDRRTEQQVERGRPRGLVEPHVTVAIRMAARRQFSRPVVTIQGGDVTVSLLCVTIVRQSVRQRRGRAGGPDEES